MENEKRLIDYYTVAYQINKLQLDSFRKLDKTSCRAYKNALDILSDAPTVDAVEVVHGKWIEKIDMVESYLADSTEVFYECSVCECANIGESPYCSNCGAKMDMGEEA